MEVTHRLSSWLSGSLSPQVPGTAIPYVHAEWAALREPAALALDVKLTLTPPCVLH